MAVLACGDCGKEVSSNANACPHCGARVPKTKWWLWVPLAVGAAVLIIGGSIPQNQADANALARECGDLVAKGHIPSMYECKEIVADIRNRLAPIPPSPAPIGRWESERIAAANGRSPADHDRISAELKAKQESDPAYLKEQSMLKEQAKTECGPLVEQQKATYRKLLASGEYWNASVSIRRCANALDSPELKRLVADAELKSYIADIKSTTTTSEEKLRSFDFLQRDYPQQAKQYEKLMLKLRD